MDQGWVDPCLLAPCARRLLVFREDFCIGKVGSL